MESNEDIRMGSTTSIVSSYLANQNTRMEPSLVPQFIREIYACVSGLGTATAIEPAKKPAVSIKASVQPDYVVCLEDGKRLKMLRRYLRSRYNLTPDQYREKWGLPSNYPMCAPNYAALRSEHAKKIGLGRAPQAAKKPARKAAK